jgi:Bacterial Ig-like domain (group 3)
MKGKKHWVVAAMMGMAGILICSALVMAQPFTSQARAAGGEADESTVTPEIFMAGPPHSKTKITADSPDPSTPGVGVELFVTVTGTGPIPTGTVNITGTDTPCNIILVDGFGTCVVNFFSTGSKTIRAYYSGDGIYDPSSASASHRVVRAKTATIITSDIPDPSDIGQEVVIQASVISAGLNIPTGMVVIKGANSNCAITLVDGSGSCSVLFTSAGSKILKATYQGDANNSGSKGAESHFVNRAASTTIITADDPDPSIPGQGVKVKVTVLGAASAPTGTVTIGGADINCLVSLSGGSGSCKVVFNTIGDKTLTATYNGNKSYFPSTTTTAHTVKNATTTTITGHNHNPSLPGEAIQVDVTVSGAGAAPTSAVTITGADVNCTITLSGGSGSCNTVQFNTGGAKIITATYNGEDPNYAGSVGTASHTVIRGLSLTTINSDDPDPSAPYASVLVTVTVAPVAPGVNTPTGYVAVTTSGGAPVCTITLAGGTGSCSVFFTSASEFTITAAYGGDATYMPSEDNEIHTVQ